MDTCAPIPSLPRMQHPTDVNRLKVSRMAGMGLTQEQIATVFGITAKTLRKHYRKELTASAIEANFKVAETLFQMATSGTNVAASIFWAKTRCGFRNFSALPVAEAPPRLVIINNDGAPRAR